MNPATKIFQLACLAVGLFSTTTVGAQTLNVAIDKNYVDPSVIADFERQTGYRINHSNPESADVILYDDTGLRSAIKEKSIALLDLKKISNKKYLDEKLLSSYRKIDPSGSHSLTYFGFPAVIAYSSKALEVAKASELTSLKVLFDTDLSNRLASHCGVAIENDRALASLIALAFRKKSGGFGKEEMAAVASTWEGSSPRIFAREDLPIQLSTGSACVAVTWSYIAVDSKKLSEKRGGPEITSVIPSEGTVISFDQLGISSSAKNIDGAYAFIDFMLDPSVSERRASYFDYYSSVKGEVNWPTNLVPYEKPTAKQGRIVERMWTNIKARK